MHEDVLLAILVEVYQPGVFLVVGYGDMHIVRLPGEQVRSRHADKDVQYPRVVPDEQVQAAVAGHIPDE